MSTAVAAQLRGCPPARPSAEQLATVREIEAIARRLAPVPAYTLIWVDGSAVGRFAETVVHHRDGRIEIIMRADLPPSSLATLMAHELGHAVDAAAGRPLDEGTADDFALAVLEYRRNIMASGLNTAPSTGRCSRCKGVIRAGEQYQREEGPAGDFIAARHVRCDDVRNGYTAAPTPSSSAPRRCVCGCTPIRELRGLARCGGCGRVFLGS